MLEPETSSTAITDQADLNTFLTKRGCSLNLKKGLHISPAPQGSGYSDTSIRHDEVLLEQPTKSNLKDDFLKAILADTGPLYAAVDPDDQYHQRSQAELERTTRESFAVIVPYPIYLETHKLILYRLGFATAVNFAEGLTEKANLINPLPRDYQAAVKLITRFSDQKITLFDAVTAVLAMQMNLPIWTYDRHFDVIQVQVWR